MKLTKLISKKHMSLSYSSRGSQSGRNINKSLLFLVAVPVLVFIVYASYKSSGQEKSTLPDTFNKGAGNSHENKNQKNNHKKKSRKDTENSNTFQSPVQQEKIISAKREYPVHQNISTTIFWIGEKAGEDNKNISNVPSAWDDQWVKRFGGVDDPKKRDGYFPAKFVPKENPFYFALPYNDFGGNGKRKKDAYKIIPWANEKEWKKDQSMCKNQWIKITKDGKTAYAQWQDVGPFGENDKEYVFDAALPKSKTNHRAGLDVSPAVSDYLNISDIDSVSWQFVDFSNVPDGPWKKFITSSDISWD